MNTKFFIGNLGTDITEGDLRDTFAVYESVVEIKLMRDRDTGRSRGFGFITLSSADEAQKAMTKMLNAPFHGRRLIINEAQSAEEWYEAPMRDLGLTQQQWDIVDRFENMLAERGLIRSGENPKLQGLLMWAIRLGSIPQLEKVLAVGANPSMVFPRGDTPLGQVAEWSDNVRRLEVFRLLLGAGADPNVLSERKTLVALAKERGNSDIIEVLADVLGEEKVTKQDLGSALLFAAAKSELPLVKRLLARGIDPDPVDAGRPGTSQSPLMFAAFGGHWEIVQVLLAAGAEVNRKDIEGRTALDYAHGNRSMARKAITVLVKAGAISGRPFQQEGGDATRGFTTASKKPAFKDALAKMKQFTGVPRRKLEGADAEIPGGYGFVVPEEQARALVKEHHTEFLTSGTYLFFTEDLTGVNGYVIALLPTNDVYRAIAAVGTEGPNSEVYNADLIAWLRDLEKEQPFSITGMGRDFIEGKFTTPIKDPAALVKRINKLCPDCDVDAESEKKQVEELKKIGRLYLWWD